MKKNGKRKGVSRRDFLKGLGGGAVTTAVISAGLLEPNRAEGASAGRLVPVRPSVSVNARQVQGLKDVLAKRLLPEIEKVAGQNEVLVTCRLNETDKEYPAPVWYGWVESKALDQRSAHQGNPPDPLIGTANVSPIYSRCLTHPQVDYVHEIDYSKPGRVGAEKTAQALRHDVDLGLNHRRFVAILANKRRVGTLTVGYTKPIADENKLRQTLINLAQKPTSPLVQYLQSNLRLGGPQI